jgi:hypothetical protein
VDGVACNAEPDPPSVRRALGLILLWAGALAIAALVLHPIKAVGVENDGYVAMAETILAGGLPRDPFRPLLYPLCTAGLGAVVGDCFVSAKMVSVIGAALLLFAAWRSTWLCFGSRPAGIVLVLVAANGHVLVHGMMASTDMLAAGLAAMAVAAAMTAWRRPTTAAFAKLGLWSALAWFTRYQAILLAVPALWACLSRAGGVGAIAVWRRAAVLLAVVAISLVPHFVLTWMAFGSPLHDENWRTVELKYLHGMVFSRIDETSCGSIMAVIAYDPGAVAAATLRELGTFITATAASLVQGGDAPTWLGHMLLVASGIGIGLGSSHRGPWWLAVLHAAAAIGSVCVLLAPLSRALLGQIWLLCAGLALLLDRLHAPLRLLATLALAVVVGVHGWREFAEFQRLHPWAEVAAARRWLDELPIPARLLSTYNFLDRCATPGRSVAIHAPYPGEDIARYVQTTVGIAQRANAAFLLVGRVSCGDVMFEALMGHADPRLEVRERTDATALFQIDGILLDWIIALRATPDPVAGKLLLQVRLREDVDGAEVFQVGVAIRSGELRQLLVLQRQDDGGDYVGSMVLPAAGSSPPITLQAVIADRQGRFGCGPLVVPQLR